MTHLPMPPSCGYVGDFASCSSDPLYRHYNSTGCCPLATAKKGWVPGVCDPCKGMFTCPAAPESSFKWGAMVAVIVNIMISVGMAMQKVAHTKVERRITESARISEEAEREARKMTFTSERNWWIGFLMQVSGEIGNLVAYGDPNTPSSVVASLGCVAVIANTVICACFLGEGWRQRDGVGVALIIMGVVLIITFVPQTKEGGTHNLLPCPMAFLSNYSAAACELPPTWPMCDSWGDTDCRQSGVAVCEKHGLLALGSDYWYMIQPEWLIYLGFMVSTTLQFPTLRAAASPVSLPCRSLNPLPLPTPTPTHHPAVTRAAAVTTHCTLGRAGHPLCRLPLAA